MKRKTLIIQPEVARKIGHLPRKKEQVLDLNTEIWNLADRTSNKLLHKWSPAVVRQLHMDAMARPENDPSVPIQPLQTNRIMYIYFLHPHWNDSLLPGKGLIRRGVRSEPRAFLGHDRHIFGEEYENKFVQRRQVLGVRRVAFIGDLIVDVCEELVVGKVQIDTILVPEILRLYQRQIVYSRGEWKQEERQTCTRLVCAQ